MNAKVKLPPIDSSDPNYLMFHWRLCKRENATPEERHAFYQGAEAVMGLLQFFSTAGMSEAELKNLSDLKNELKAEGLCLPNW